VTEGRLRSAILLLAIAGLAISGYLTYVHYAEIEPICAASGACERVQNSKWAELAGIPVAVMGVAGYAAILAASLARAGPARLLASTLALAGFGFSLYLTYLELFEIDAICQWCVASAVLMSLLAVLTCVRAMRGEMAAG